MRLYKDRQANLLGLNDPKYRCFLCCHVRTGTLLLGTYHLMTQLICMSVLMFACVHPEMLMSKVPLKAPNDLGNFDMSSTNFGNDMPPGRIPFNRHDVMAFTRGRFEAGDAHLALMLITGLFIITLMMIHGVLRNRPWYLLPFFCFQVFDFILACLTAVGHYAWLPNMSDMVANNPGAPWHDHLNGVDGQWLALAVLMAYICVLFVKSYLIGVVWACYQYLHAKNMLVMAAYQQDSCGGDAMLLPPDYDEATKMAPAMPPPPEYTAKAAA